MSLAEVMVAASSMSPSKRYYLSISPSPIGASLHSGHFSFSLSSIGHQLAQVSVDAFGHEELSVEHAKRSTPLFATGVVDVALPPHYLACATDVEAALRT